MNGSLVGLAVAALVGPQVVPAVTYITFAERQRRGWAPPVGTPLALPGGGYRGGVVVPPAPAGRAPWVVRLAAYSCWLLGQAFGVVLLGAAGCVFLALQSHDVPQAVATLLCLGLAVGVLATPGMFVAWHLFGAGLALVRRDFAAATRARDAARSAILLNLAILGGGGLLAVMVGSGGFLVACAVVGAYALVSLAQAALVLRASRAVDRFETQLEHGAQARALAAQGLPPLVGAQGAHAHARTQ